MELNGRVVAVTGGARGIGLAIARTLAAAGARVAIGDLDGDLAAQVASGLGPDGVGLGLDVRFDDSYAQFLHEAVERLGPLDALVNNAGVAVPGPFLATGARSHRLEIEVNLGGVERGMRLALPAMLSRRRGHIVNIASASGRIAAPGAAVYTATKHAVVALTDAVRVELHRSGVRLTAVLPAAVRTEMAAGLRLRGLPQVSPDLVAFRVARAMSRRRPPAVVMVPRWLGPVAVLDAASPHWLRSLARRIIVVSVAPDASSRAGYAERLSHQLDN